MADPHDASPAPSAEAAARRHGPGHRALEQIVARQPLLARLPVLGNADFGHTNPLATLPIGGRVEIIASDAPYIDVLEH